MTLASEFDTVVVGLGVMGSAALWRLAERGSRVAGVEQFEPGHTRGASHGQSRIIRTAYAEGATYVPLAIQAWRLWDELYHKTAVPLVTRTGGLIMAPSGTPAVNAPLSSALAHGLSYELLSAADIRSRFPQHAIDDDTSGFYERDAGVIRAEEAVRALLDAAAAPVFTNSRVVAIEPGRVTLTDRTLTARHIVVAAGGWTASLLPSLRSRIEVVRRIFAWFPVESQPDLEPDRFPIFMRGDASAERTWYGVPAMDRRTVKIGVHTWPGIDERVDVEAGARPPDASDAAFMGELVRSGLRGLGSSPVRMQACTYSLTPDHDFLVGPMPGVSGMTLLAGFSGHGFKFAPVLGDIAADLATSGETRWDIGFLSPGR